MSSTEEDEQKDYVRTAPGAMTVPARQVVTVPAGEVVTTRSGDGAVQQVIAEPVVKRESIAKHTTTNSSALVGLAVGIVVLAIGLLLVVRETPFLPYPWSIFSVLLVGAGLIAIGASLVSNRTTDAS